MKIYSHEELKNPLPLPRQRGSASTSYMGDTPLKHFPVDTGAWTLPWKHSPTLVSLLSLWSELKLFGKFLSSNLRPDFVQFCWVGPKHDNLIRRSRPPCMLMLAPNCLFQISSGTESKFSYQSHVRFFDILCKGSQVEKAGCLPSLKRRQ